MPASHRYNPERIAELAERYDRELAERGAMTASPDTLSVAQAGRSKIVDRHLDAAALADRIEAGELLSDKSMSDREFLAPLLDAPERHETEGEEP